MTEPSGPAGSSVARPRSSFVRRGLPLLVLFVLLGVVDGALAAFVLPKHWTASASVLVNDTGAGGVAQPTGARTTGVVDPDTESQVLQSQTVIQRAQTLDRALAGRSYTSILTDISITVPPNTTVLTIGFTDTSALHAMRGANALARAYLDDRRTFAQAHLQQQVNAVNKQIRTISTQLQATQGQLAKLPASSAQRTYYSSARGLLVTQLANLNAQLLTYQTTAVTPGRILRLAQRPASPSSPSIILCTASGLGVGLLVGIFAAWVARRWSRRVRSTTDLAEVVDAPVLASVPAAWPDVEDWRRSPAAEAVRRLAVITATSVSRPASVLTASLDSSAGVTALAAGLAGALADDGAAVRMLHIGPDAPTITRALPAVTTIPELDGLRAIAAGVSLQARLLAVRGDDDYLVLDVRGLPAGADAHRLAPLVDAVVLVVTSGTSRRSLRGTLQSLDEIGAPLLGTVFVKRVTSARPDRGKGRAKAATDDATPAAEATEPEIFAARG